MTDPSHLIGVSDQVAEVAWLSKNTPRSGEEGTQQFSRGQGSPTQLDLVVGMQSYPSYVGRK